MKITVSYLVRETKTVEMSATEYLKFKSNLHSRPDILPDNSFDEIVTIDEDSKNELLDFFYENK